ncbi:MAG: type IV pilin-like G/H family protein [Prochloraceae cyanobacterium]|nr:type IV pilin-like G/H family protein [Prochloraceae cyanobacterium]
MMNGAKAKLIQYYLNVLHKNNNKKNSKGFTLLELLIVVVILGIISAIAIPSFLNQAAKAKETEARQNISTFNKYQQLYYLENTSFANSFNALAMGNITDINSETKYYEYRLEEYVATTRIKIRAVPKDPGVREYMAGVRRELNAVNVPVIINVACRNRVAGVSNLSINIFNGTCGSNGDKLYGNGR